MAEKIKSSFDSKLKEYCMSCFNFANNKMFSKNYDPYKCKDYECNGYLVEFEGNDNLSNFSHCCRDALLEANKHKEKEFSIRKNT